MSNPILDLRGDLGLTPTLHLLRTYTDWRGVKEYSTKEAIQHIHMPPEPYMVFGTHTRRYPVRAEDMTGGSVYWCKRGVTMFRMPLHAIESTDFGWWILMEPMVYPVHPLRVGQVRGWRYLEHERAPDDNEGLFEMLMTELEMEAAASEHN